MQTAYNAQQLLLCPMRSRFHNDRPTNISSLFACDVLNRSRQCIFILREAFSSYTVTKLIPDEKSATLEAALIKSIAELSRVDAATAFQALSKDPQLTKLGISLELGRHKNRNRKPVAEKAVQELEKEPRRFFQSGARSDGSKHLGRELYIITDMDQSFVHAQKFTSSQLRTRKYKLVTDFSGDWAWISDRVKQELVRRSQL